MNTPEKSDVGERRSRIRALSRLRESGSGMETTDLGVADHKLSFGHLGLQAANMMPLYEAEGRGDVDSDPEMYVTDK